MINLSSPEQSADERSPGGEDRDTPSSSRSSDPTRVHSLLFFVLSAVASAPMLFFLIRMFPLETDTTYPESAVIYDCLKVSAGEILYQDFTEEPYIITPYTPLYYLVGGVVGGVFSCTEYALRLVCRAISLASFLICGALAFMVTFLLASTDRGPGVHRSGKFSDRFRCLPHAAGCLAAVSFLNTSSQFGWNVTARPDFLAMLFSALGFVVFMRAVAPLSHPVKSLGVSRGNAHSFSPSHLLIAGLLMLMAWYTKQSYNALPLSCLVFLFLTKRFREVLLFSCATLVPGFLIFVLVQVFLAPEFYHNIVLSVGGAVKIENPLHLFLIISLPEKLILITGGAMCVVLLIKRRHMFFSLVALVTLALSTLGTIRCGSDTNYFIEPFFYMSCAASLLFVSLLRGAGKAVFVTLLAAVMIIQASVAARTVSGELAEQVKQAFGEKLLLERLGSRDWKVLSLDPYITLKTGRPPVLFDAYHLTKLEMAGLWNQELLVHDLRTRRFDFIITVHRVDDPHRLAQWQGIPQISRTVREAIVENYWFVRHYYVWALYCSKQQE